MRTDIRSARPRLLRLGNALLLLAIRPSLSLWTSSNDGKDWSKEINLAAAHNQALPDDSKLRFCPEFGSRSHKYMANGTIYQDQWLESGYASLVRVGPSTAMTCYVRETEHSLPSQIEPPPQCQSDGPLMCMRIQLKTAKTDDAQKPLNIGTSLQLVAVDDLIVASTANLTTTMHSPDVSRVAIESNPGFAISTYSSALLDPVDGKIKIWYSMENNTLGCGHNFQPPCGKGLPPQPHYDDMRGIRTAYAESDDGVRRTSSSCLSAAI